MAGFLSSADLDFDTYKANLKTFLKSQTQFRDYDFDGSNMSVLIDILAYNTYLNGFYLNQVGSEMFLDTAMLRESAVSRAKELNYVPRSRVSSKAQIVLTVQAPANNAPSTLTIPKGFYVSGSANGKTYLFSTDQAYVIRNENGAYSSGNVYVYEGRLVTEYFVANSSAKYTLASANVDISSLSVTVQVSNTNTSNTVYSRAYNLYGLSNTSTVYFVQGYRDNYYEIVFGNGVTGDALDDGNVVKVQYRDATGPDADYINKFTAVSTINSYAASVTTSQASFGGAERETIDSIKFNAPRHFSSQDRAINKTDYAILIKNNFPMIQAVSIFGGEELSQKRYGKVAIATKPYGAEITPDSIKTQIGTFLNERTSVAIDPIFIDPDYFYVTISSNVKYNQTITSLSTSDIETLVRAAIDTYNSSYLYDFNSNFRYSKLSSAIDNAETSIVSNDTTVWMTKRLLPAIGTPFVTDVKFGNQLSVDGVHFPAPAGLEPIVSSDYFTYAGNAAAYLRDNGVGGIYVVTQTSTGETLLNDDVGIVNYDTGEVSLYGLTVDSYNGHINLKAKLEAKDIIIAQNQIIVIDQDDVTIGVYSAET